MPKNKGKGGKSRRRGKGEGDTRRELTRKMEGTEYAKVSKMLGGLHLEAVCMDGRTRQCRIPGSLRRRVWIGAGDIVLVGLREFEEAKGEVILKYSADEARQLKAEGALPPHVTINDTAIGEAGAAEERGFEFGAGGDSEDDESSDGEVDVDAI